MSSTLSAVPLSAKAVQTKISAGAQVIDVREAGEYKREHIAQATLIPLSSFNATKVAQTLLRTAQSADAKKDIVVYCASGGRSQEACQKLAKAVKGSDMEAAWIDAGVRLYDISGGIQGWKQAGGAVNEDVSAPLPIMRQVQMIAGSLIITGSVLSMTVDPRFVCLPAFVGCGLFVAGSTGFCGMAKLLQLLPYNQVQLDDCNSCNKRC